jgi:hypothetical protein
VIVFDDYAQKHPAKSGENRDFSPNFPVFFEEIPVLPCFCGKNVGESRRHRWLASDS